MSLADLFEWFKEQVQYVLFFVLLIILIVSGFKRAWIAMISALFGVTFIGMFVFDPELIQNVSEWLSGKLAIGE